jgi:hypothetical protein
LPNCWRKKSADSGRRRDTTHSVLVEIQFDRCGGKLARGN